MAIQDYDISIENCPGKNNLVADTLNHLPEQEKAEKWHTTMEKLFYTLWLKGHHRTYEIGYRILPKSKN